VAQAFLFVWVFYSMRKGTTSILILGDGFEVRTLGEVFPADGVDSGRIQARKLLTAAGLFIRVHGLYELRTIRFEFAGTFPR
jgi:hypothetical protein